MAGHIGQDPSTLSLNGSKPLNLLVSFPLFEEMTARYLILPKQSPLLLAAVTHGQEKGRTKLTFRLSSEFSSVHP